MNKIIKEQKRLLELIAKKMIGTDNNVKVLVYVKHFGDCRARQQMS